MKKAHIFEFLSIRDGFDMKIKFSSYALILVVIVWIVVLAATLYLIVKPVREPSIDFFSYYIAGYSLKGNMSIYSLADHDKVANIIGIKNADLYIYPPFFAILIQSLISRNPFEASLIWFGINVILLIICVALLLRLSQSPSYGIKMM